MLKIFLIITSALVFNVTSFVPLHAASPFDGVIENQTRIMIAITDAGNAGDFTGYAENLLKKKFKLKGAAIINPEIMKKVKEDKLLWAAIQNGSATAMAKISTDYGAVVLVRGTLSVDTRQKFAASWEGTASLSIMAVDTNTAEEIANVNSDPLGTTLNPSPIEDSPLIAKQRAVEKVCDNVLIKMGISGTSDITAVKTISFELYDVFTVPDGNTSSFVFSQDGKKLFAAAGNAIQVLSLPEKRFVDSYNTDGQPTVLAVNPRNNLMAAGDSRGGIHLWDTAQGINQLNAKTKAGNITAIALQPGSDIIAAAGKKNDIHIISASTGNEIGILDGHRKTINSLAFTPNGQNLISSSNDLSIKWWDVNVMREKKAMQESANKLLCMALSQDGGIVALSTVDIHIDLQRNIRRDIRHIMVRNTVTGEEIRELEGHKKDVTTLSFHPDKRFLASGSIDDTVRIWDLQKGDMVTFLELNDDVLCVNFSLDGKWFAASSKDRKIMMWKLR